MKLKDKEKLTNPLKGWPILSSISSMVFHTVSGAELVKIIKVEKQLSSQSYNFVKKKMILGMHQASCFYIIKKKTVFEGVLRLRTNLPPFIGN